ncbi:hypothetical protein H0H93_011264 [Arthromyces matolae]|nr:hypothetical protein H0H93_011264 [Arthromyces matolae]
MLDSLPPPPPVTITQTSSSAASSVSSTRPPSSNGSSAPQLLNASSTRPSSANGSSAPQRVNPPPNPNGSSTQHRVQAPYRPGFQPRGLYRPLTDDFIAMRNLKRDGDGMKRVERTKLHRRLEKLIDLHFPSISDQNSTSRLVLGSQTEHHRRASSFFDFDIKKINISDPGGLWRGMVGGSDVQDIRAPCSMLFVVDLKTRQIEEVDAGVDYGVRRKPQGTNQNEGPATEEKFLNGALIALEQEIEESLPQFQELVLSLSHHDQPSKEAIMSRKRLLEAFAQYDALAKRIRKLPCSVGSSADQVQTSIMNRANQFLQKNMFPLQSLPRPQKVDSKMSCAPESNGSARQIDADSQLAMTLQPLLEQEALLESYVEEAKIHRKFEDVKTLKGNLQEIRAEIDRMVASSESGNLESNLTTAL